MKEAGLEEAFVIDSAGTVAWGAGNPPDTLAQATAVQKGIDIGHLRARKLTRKDLEYFDLVLVADESNYLEVVGIASEASHGKIQYLMSYADAEKELVIPDPFGGNIQGFMQVFRMIEDACTGLLIVMRQEMD